MGPQRRRSVACLVWWYSYRSRLTLGSKASPAEASSGKMQAVSVSNPPVIIRARQKQQGEPVAAVMWAVIEGLARFTQASVVRRIGVTVRLEAIRTEKHQTRYQPLIKHVRLWQQMVTPAARGMGDVSRGGGEKYRRG
jgi:hypothetical protein